jgi:hypothetical protein
MVDFMPTDGDKPRQSLEEMAAQANGGDNRGISCPKCACRHCPAEPSLGVDKTITLGPNKSIRRIRNCRHCGHHFNTYERVAAVAQSMNENDSHSHVS